MSVSRNSGCCRVSIFSAALDAQYPNNLCCANFHSGSLLNVSDPRLLDIFTMRPLADFWERQHRLCDHSVPMKLVAKMRSTAATSVLLGSPSAGSAMPLLIRYRACQIQLWSFWQRVLWCRDARSLVRSPEPPKVLELFSRFRSEISRAPSKRYTTRLSELRAIAKSLVCSVIATFPLAFIYCFSFCCKTIGVNLVFLIAGSFTVGACWAAT